MKVHAHIKKKKKKKNYENFYSFELPVSLCHCQSVSDAKGQSISFYIITVSGNNL